MKEMRDHPPVWERLSDWAFGTGWVIPLYGVFACALGFLLGAWLT